MSEINEQLPGCVEKMPAFPQSVHRIIQLTADADCSAKDIVHTIECDPVMTVKILKVINSAFYGLPKKITSIQRASVHLGLNTIKNMALSIAATGMLGNTAKAGLQADGFLLHSLTTALLGKRLAERLGCSAENSSDIYIAGLLHDFGKLVFAEYFPGKFKQALQIAREENISLHLAEQQVIGIDHAQAGRLLMEKWQLAEDLATAIALHHEPQNGDLLSDCIFVANQISKKMHFGDAGNAQIEPLPGTAVERFGMQLQELIDALGDLSPLRTEANAFILL